MGNPYDWDAVAETVEFSIQPDLRQLHSIVPIHACVLDFGCGYGRVAVQLERAGYTSVCGYDQSRQMIERGRRLYPQLQLRHLPGLPVPEDNSSYGAVVCCAVLTTIPARDERRSLLDELWRLLEPGGVLYAVEFLKSPERTYRDDGSFTSALGPAMKHFDAQELIRELDEFTLLDGSERDDVDLRGGKARVFHGLWQKPCRL